MFRILPALMLVCACTFQAMAQATVQTLNTPRAFPDITSRTAWETRAKEIREQVLVSCGLWPMPRKTPLHPKIFGRLERDGYTIEKVYFQPSPGFYLAGNLYRPRDKVKGRVPGVLIAHGHWKEGRLVDDNDASKAALGITFARAGMVAFSFDMVGFNDTRFPDWPMDKPFYDVHRMFATNQTDELWGISLMGLQTWNSIRALDFLESVPEVDKQRLACTGASGGGTQTFMLGAIDDRLAAQAPVCMVSHTMQGGCSCENAPGLRVQYSNMEIAAAAAPRPQILVGATGDWTKSLMEVEGPAIERVYDLSEAKDDLRYVRFDFGHNYNQTSREAVYEWFYRWLLKQPTLSSKEPPHQKESAADLRVFPDGKLPSDALPMAQFIEALKQSHQQRWQALIPKSKTDFQKFRKMFAPAWKQILQLTTAIPEPRKKSVLGPKTYVVVGNDVSVDSHLTANLNATNGVFRIVCSEALAERNEHTNFFTTYNRTLLQESCGIIISNCVRLRENPGQVVLVGSAASGLWALLAAPAADAVVADCGALDANNDEALVKSGLFCPGIRNIGGFEGAAMLAAPHPLLLHNTGDKFPTDAIRAAYRALGASKQLRIESRQLTDDEIVKWLSQLN